MNAAWPGDIDLSNCFGTAEPEVHARVAGARVPSARGGVIILNTVVRRYANLRSKPHAVALRAHQLHFNPVVPTGRDVVEVLYLPIQNCDDRVDAAIIIDIAVCKPAMGIGLLEIRTSLAAHVLKLSFAYVP